MRAARWLLILLACPASAFASFHGSDNGPTNNPLTIDRKIGFDQRLGSTVDGSLFFLDEEGKRVRIEDYWARGPLVLALVYFGCPNLCSLSLNGLFKALGQVRAVPGKDYSVVAVSIDPSENVELAREKRENLLRAYGHAEARRGIHFLTGEESSIKALAGAVGFRYVYDGENRQFAHPAGVVVITPGGKISKYLFGVDYPNQGLRLALVEASESRIGSPIENFLLYCYHYDPAMGTYTLAVRRILSAAALVTALTLIAGIWWGARSQPRAKADGV